MSSTRVFRSIALMAGATALAWAAILSGAQSSQAQMSVPLAPGDPAPTDTADPAPSDTAAPAPSDTANPSYAPANPVDCTDPNNAVNCQTPPIDSPLVVGTADPGSPFRD
jgi:hypothetical protein